MTRRGATPSQRALVVILLAAVVSAPAAAAPDLKEAVAVRIADPPSAELRVRGVVIARLVGPSAWASRPRR